MSYLKQHGTRRVPQRVALPDLLVIGDMRLETERRHVFLAPVRVVEPDPAEELVGREVEDHQVVADVHVPVVVDPLGSHHIAISVQRSVDHAARAPAQP